MPVIDSIEQSPKHVFLTEYQLAARHQCSVKTLRNQRVAGVGIKHVKLGRLVRYRLSDIEAWEEANLRRSTSDTRGGTGELASRAPGTRHDHTTS
jgi:hypothetical protein